MSDFSTFKIKFRSADAAAPGLRAPPRFDLLRQQIGRNFLYVISVDLVHLNFTMK